MKNYNSIAFGWKYNQAKTEAVIKKKSQFDWLLSIIIAFLIVFIIAQIISVLDKSITSPLSRASQALAFWKIETAQAAENETMKLIQSHREINIVKGVGFTFEVGFKNKTNYTWVRTGSNSVDLKIAPPYNRDTVVRHKFWADSQTPAWLKDNQAKPGWIAYYRFALEAPKEAGVYTEKFVLVNYGDKHILSGSEFEITMNVWNSTAEFPKGNVAVNAPQPTPRPAVNQPVATPTPQPVASPAASTPAPEVDSQGVVVTEQIKLGRTCLDLSAKKFRISTTVPMSLVEDCRKIGIDLTPNIYTDPVVAPPSPSPSPANSPSPASPGIPADPLNISANGPIIRIGLFYSTDPVVITANTSFKVTDKNGAVLADLAVDKQAQITFNFSSKTYNLSANGQATSTSSYLKLIGSQDNTIFEIVSYDQRPAWNQSLNDNKYLGALEVRYAQATHRLWVINELPLEIYLQGLAETSNDSPMEYQKALVTAARTYAMYHYNRGTKHASENFTLDAKYDQVYRGYGSQSRLSKVVAAVNQTKGMMVTYNNEVVVTPYFSYSDGQTRNWEDVWGGSPVPWCRSVKEPAGYNKTTLYGHGVGMSAYGAMMLAADYNYAYDQILKYYYTGVDLKKIY
jgi:hypothetical protein